MKIFLLTAFIFLIVFATKAQDNQHRGGRLEALKIAYITNKLNLSTDEAQKFWPVYNKYAAEIKQAYIQNKGGDEVDKEAKIVEIRKNYKVQFAKVLPDEKVNAFFKADKEFNTMAQKEMMERRQSKDQKRPS